MVLELFQKIGELNKYDQQHIASIIFIAAQQGCSEIVQFLLLSGFDCQRPYILSAQRCRQFVTDEGRATQERMDAKINQRLSLGDTEEKMCLLPQDIAEVMGYKEIEDLLKQKVEITSWTASTLRDQLMHSIFNPRWSGVESNQFAS